jgi:tetratricopeptide (TPR) repeat protein
LRFLWLAAQVSLENGNPAETIEQLGLVRDFLAGPNGTLLNASVRADVAANANLLAARAQFDLGDSTAGLATLVALRRDFADSRPAIYSHIVEARYHAAAGRIADARKTLLALAETHRNSEYAPVALFEAALLAEMQGNFLDAIQIFSTFAGEQRADETPEQWEARRRQFESFRIAALLEQGNVYRKLNQFRFAEARYEQLRNSLPDGPERQVVELTLTAALMAQAGDNPEKFTRALSIMERLTYTDASVDLRVEAGVRLAEGWKAQGQPERAEREFHAVYNLFLVDPEMAGQLGATGRYWMVRAIFELGNYEKERGEIDNARRLFQSVLDHQLGHAENLARAQLALLNGGG